MVEEVALDHLHSTAFQHTPLGRTILGSAQNIQNMTKEAVEAYIRAHYTSGVCPLKHAHWVRRPFTLQPHSSARI